MRHFLALLAFMAFCAPVGAQSEASPPLPPPPPPPPADSSPIEGTWVTELQSEITIAPCETGLCGILSKIVVPDAHYQASKAEIDAIGIENLTDYKNPDPLLKERTLLGLQIINLNKKISPGMYEGEVYNPEDGNTYFGRVELVDLGTVRLTGCAFVILCQSQNWIRAPEIAEPTPDLHYAQLPPAPPPQAASQ